MHRYRKGQMFRPPTTAESAATADAVEAHRVRPGRPQDRSPVGQTVIVKTHEDGIPARDGDAISFAMCKRVIQRNTATGKEFALTDEQVIVFNITEAMILGDVYMATALTECGVRYVLPLGGTITGMLKTSLAPGGTAEMYLTKLDGTIIDESTPLTVTVKDTIGDKRAIGKDDRSAGGAMVLAEVLADGTVAIRNIHQQANEIKATAKGAISGSTGTVDNVVATDRGMSPTGAAADELSVNNPLNYYVADDGVCLLKINESSDPVAYGITGVVMTTVSPLTDWQYNDSSEDIEEKTRATRANVAGDESAWTKIDDTEECCEVT